MPMNEEQKAQVQLVSDELKKMAEVVYRMLEIYDKNDWLNDEIDITSVIPMSLDEWHLELNTKSAELKSIIS